MDNMVQAVDLEKFTKNLTNLEGLEERNVFEIVMRAKSVEDLLAADITAEQVFSCMKNIKTLATHLENNVLTTENMFAKMQKVVSSGRHRALL